MLVRMVFAPALLALAACSGGKGDEQAGLNIGDQLKLLQLALEKSGESQPIAGKLRWTTFTDGPHMNAAFLADAIDIGWMGDTPALLAAAAKADVVVIAGASHPANGLYAIVAPAGSGIKTLADLRGKRIAFTRGTALQGFLLTALDSVGLRQSDIVPVDLPGVSLASALKSGGADAAILAGPLLSGYLVENPGAIEIAAPNSGSNVLVATRRALGDPVKRPLIEEFVARGAKAWRWTEANKDQWLDTLYKEVFHQGPEEVKLLKARGGYLKLVGPVDASIEQGLKQQAALLAQAKVLPDATVVNTLFEPALTRRFNAIITNESASPRQ